MLNEVRLSAFKDFTMFVIYGGWNVSVVDSIPCGHDICKLSALERVLSSKLFEFYYSWP